MLSSLIEEIASDEVLEEAYAWLCERRENYSHNDEVWEVRYRWREIKLWLQGQLLAGRYRFSPLRRIHRTNDDLEIWSALDSLFASWTTESCSLPRDGSYDRLFES